MGDSMKSTVHGNGWIAPTRFTRARAALALPALGVLATFGLVNPAHAALPPAGTPIGNQASATYSDAAGNPQPAVQSNTVETRVAQVASFTLSSSPARQAGPGATVYYPHVLTNTGNGTDTFDLTASDVTSGTFNLTSVQLYADANGDGLPDNFTALSASGTTGPIAAGATFQFVAASVVPISATAGQTDTMTVSATGNSLAAAGAVPPYATAAAQSVSDVITITSNAVVNVTKSMSALSGADGSGPYQITLTYTNAGNASSPNITLTDALPAGMSYVAGSARWSTSGPGTPLTDNTGAPADPAGMAFDFNASAAGAVTAIVTQGIAPGVSGTVTFQVNVPANTPAGQLNNTATYSYNDGTGTIITGQTTNTVAFSVLRRAGVTLDDVPSTANGVAPTLVADSNPIADIVGVASAPQGATVQFDNVVHNNGNTPDSFDISFVSNSFPAGTTFQLFRSDGVTPLTDSNGNSTPDTGTLAIGASYHVIVKAILPANASGNNAGAGFSLVNRASSFVDPTTSDITTDRLDAIVGSTVDMTNNAALPGGAGAGNTGAAVITTNTANPGTATVFQLFVNNTSTVADSYDLSVTSALPLNWLVEFKQDGGSGNCSTTGASLSNTGVINPAQNRLVCAVVTVPASGAGALAGTTNITFQVRSAASGAQDVKTDAVTVNTVRGVTVAPNNSGQAFPGGAVDFTHVASNAGNVDETLSFVGTFLSDSQAAAGWTSVVYEDTNLNGVLDAADVALTSTSSLALAAGNTQTIFVKVFAPSTAAIGQVDTTSLTVTYNNTTGVAGGPLTANVLDTTTVISGNVGLVKEQALDALCDGTADSAFTTTDVINSAARPGACIRYRITITNRGTTNVQSVVVNDATPTDTVYNTGAQCYPTPAAAGSAGAATTVGAVAAVPANCAVGTLRYNVGTLTPSQSAVLTFGVQIRNN
jgi:trimeric autotransporter adhesin